MQLNKDFNVGSCFSPPNTFPLFDFPQLHSSKQTEEELRCYHELRKLIWLSNKERKSRMMVLPYCHCSLMGDLGERNACFGCKLWPVIRARWNQCRYINTVVFSVHAHFPIWSDLVSARWEYTEGPHLVPLRLCNPNLATMQLIRRFANQPKTSSRMRDVAFQIEQPGQFILKFSLDILYHISFLTRCRWRTIVTVATDQAAVFDNQIHNSYYWIFLRRSVDNFQLCSWCQKQIF